MKNPSGKYIEIVDDMPPGLERACLRTINFHEGLENAIGKGKLLADLAAVGFHVDERQMRKAIVRLRKQGHLICASSGEGGYYLAKNRAEYDAFVEKEYKSKIIDMAETARAMDQSAMAKWGPLENSLQESLF